ncbi:MAG: VOC family protein [Caulobacteraceae bacterium]|nr:VOC family protein [Caulobacteraceae bacterium]
MLGSATVTALVGTMKPEIAKAFYGDTLGLKFISDDGFALVFEGKNARVRVSRVPGMAPAAYAVLAFEVADIERLWMASRPKALSSLVSGSLCRMRAASGAPPTAQKSPGFTTLT